MNVKLTLSIDALTIEKAKKYAASQNVSVSKLVERYLNTLESNVEEGQMSPAVQELLGIMSSFEGNVRETYRNHLAKKHS